jgi:predicted helicase
MHQLVNFINNDLIDFILADKIISKQNDIYDIIELRDYQDEAVISLANNNASRMCCFMACGTGKTIVMFEYIDMMGITHKRILFLLPSLQLVSQTYKNFIRYNAENKKANILCICSQMDKTAMTCGEGNDLDNENIFNEFLALDAPIILYIIYEDLYNRSGCYCKKIKKPRDCCLLHLSKL